MTDRPAARRRGLDEVIDMTPHMDRPHLTTRGTLYAALRDLGCSDFVAGAHAFNAPGHPPPDTPATLLGPDRVRHFLTHGPHATGA